MEEAPNKGIRLLRSGLCSLDKSDDPDSLSVLLGERSGIVRPVRTAILAVRIRIPSIVVIIVIRPVALNLPIRAAQGDVRSAEGPGAFVTIFRARAVIPCIAVRIGPGFRQLVSRNIGEGGKSLRLARDRFAGRSRRRHRV